MSQYVGIDIGTTRTKVGCYDAASTSLIAVRAATTPRTDDEDGGVRDAAELMAVVRRLLAELFAEPAVDATRVQAMSVGSIGEEIVLLDEHGAAVAPIPTWHGAHGPGAKLAFADPSLADVDESFSIFKLAWLARHLPDRFARARTFTSVADYVAGVLCGDTAAEVVLNASHASRTGLLNLDDVVLREDVLDGVGVRRLRLPRLVRSATRIGETRGIAGVPDGITIVTGGHDHWCGAFGAGVRAAGDVYISAGTSEAQVMLVEEPPRDHPRDIDRGMFLTDGLRYLHRATPSGRMYQAWHQMLYAGVDDATLWREVEEADTHAAAADVAAESVRIASMPVDVTRGAVMASLLKGLAVEAERITELLVGCADRPAEKVTVAGVPATVPVWQRLRQDAARRRLEFVSEPEATVFGVALLAQFGVEGRADTPLTAVYSRSR